MEHTGWSCTVWVILFFSFAIAVLADGDAYADAAAAAHGM